MKSALHSDPRRRIDMQTLEILLEHPQLFARKCDPGGNHHDYDYVGSNRALATLPYKVHRCLDIVDEKLKANFVGVSWSEREEAGAGWWLQVPVTTLSNTMAAKYRAWKKGRDNKGARRTRMGHRGGVG